MAGDCPAATSGDDPVGGGEGNQESRERERAVHEGVFCIWGSGQNREKNVVESCSSNAASGQS